jgi:hypothetical protein
MRSWFFSLAFLFPAELALSQSLPPSAPSNGSAIANVKLSGGLEASLPAGIGRSQNSHNVTVVLSLENKGKAAVQLALVGPTPFAVDNAGTSYTMTSFSGAGACRELGVHYIPMCIVGTEVAGMKIPIALEAFTQIDPGATAILTFGLNGREGSGNQMSFSSVFAYRVISDPLADETLSEADRRRQFRTLSVGFPPHSITQQK